MMLHLRLKQGLYICRRVERSRSVRDHFLYTITLKAAADAQKQIKIQYKQQIKKTRPLGNELLLVNSLNILCFRCFS